MTLLTLLEQRATEEWLLGIDAARLIQLTQDRLQILTSRRSTAAYPVILLAEADPTYFLAGLIAACTASCPVFLCNPNWGLTEWQQVFALVQPDLIWGTCPLPVPFPTFSLSLPPQPNWIMIPTGGSSGQIRFAIHTLTTLFAAATSFQEYFAVEQVNACCVLPLYHVSGLMQFLRVLVSGGQLAVLPFRTLDQTLTAIDPSRFFLSLVPTQLQRLLQDATTVEWLQQFHTVLLGGAPAWTDLLNQARHHQIRLAPTYGMTETASQVVTLKPEQFLQGMNGCGQVLPHANIQILPERHASDGHASDSHAFDSYACDSANPTGPIVVQAHSLMLGYFPHALYLSQFQTDDLGFFDAQGILQVVGRNSQKIITGGENVFPTEVEVALRSTNLVHDVCVIGMPDQTWGEVVTAIYVPNSPEVTVSTLKAALAPQLSHFKHPKQWVAVKSLPRNAQGKINYEQIKQIL